jgi:hypothetical protein
VSKLVHRILEKPVDILFVGIVALSIVLAVGAVISEFHSREAALLTGGARRIDLPLVRKQISGGNLSDRKALYFKKAPR